MCQEFLTMKPVIQYLFFQYIKVSFFEYEKTYLYFDTVT